MHDFQLTSGPRAAYVAPECLGPDLAAWRAQATAGAGIATLWREYGVITSYPYATGPGYARDYVDTLRSRRLYWCTADLVRHRLTRSPAHHVQNAAVWRLAATMLDEMLTATRVCTGCAGRDEHCFICCGTRMEPQSLQWRAARSQVSAHLLNDPYQQILGELAKIEQQQSVETPAGNYAY